MSSAVHEYLRFGDNDKLIYLCYGPREDRKTHYRVRPIYNLKSTMTAIKAIEQRRENRSDDSECRVSSPVAYLGPPDTINFEHSDGSKHQYAFGVYPLPEEGWYRFFYRLDRRATPNEVWAFDKGGRWKTLFLDFTKAEIAAKYI